MNAEQGRAIDDLAFLRALAEGGGEHQRATGAALVAGGLLYGAQCFIFGAQAYGWVQLSDTTQSVVALGITVAFLVAIAWISLRNRTAPTGGIVARALNAVFASAGTATLSLLAAFLSVALREKSLTIWFLYPCAVFALQGAAWTAAWMLRRRAWIGVVALGWLISAVVLALSLGTLLYPLIAGFALVTFMAVPGRVMMRSSAD
jgi:hypothetical protein